MLNFEYYTPTKVVFGKDTEKQAGELVKAFTIGTIVVIIILAVGGTVIYTIKRKEANHEN